MREFKILSIKEKLTKCERSTFMTPIRSSQENMNACKKLIHAKWLYNVIIATGAKTFEFVFKHRLSSDKQNRHLAIFFSHFLRQSKTILLWHHHIKNAEIKWL